METKRNSHESIKKRVAHSFKKYAKVDKGGKKRLREQIVQRAIDSGIRTDEFWKLLIRSQEGFSNDKIASMCLKKKFFQIKGDGSMFTFFQRWEQMNYEEKLKESAELFKWMQ